MRTYTSLAWPDDPYRASQQLYARPSPMLAAFAVLPAGKAALTAPAGVAVAYLPLHRTRVITVTEETVAFGFCAASTADVGGIGRLAAFADLNLMQARRHARYLAGYELSVGLQALRAAAPALAARGLAAVAAGWADRKVRPRGAAPLVDISADLGDPAGASCAADVVITPASSPSLASDSVAAEPMAAAAAERALAIALICARSLGRYQWETAISTARIMAATTWDLFPTVTWDDTACQQPVP
jgi:hypothetical protein